MSLVAKGKVVNILNVESGTSKAGKEWKKQHFVIDTGDQYNPNVCFSVFGEKISILQGVSVGEDVEVSFNLSSREYNGRYFHNVDAWKIDKVGAGAPPAGDPFAGAPAPMDNAAEADDLPF